MVCIFLIKFIITFGDETSPCSWVYAVGYPGFSFCQAMSVPAFKTTMLAMLIQKVKAREGEGWSLRSLPGWFSGAAHPVSQSDMRSMWWVTLEISLFRWMAPPVQARVVEPLYDGVYDSPVIYRWREPIVSVSTGRNRCLIVLG
jgi:hypothetical protein